MMDEAGLGQEPTEIPPANLGGAFGPPATSPRSASLAGRLAQRSTSPTATPHPEAGGVGESADTQSEARPPTTRHSSTTESRSRRAKPKRATTPSDADTDDKQVTVVVYLSLALRERVRRATTRNRTYADVIYDAIEATKDQLPPRWAPEQAPSGRVFERRPRRRTRHEEPPVSLLVRLDPRNVEIIDGLWAEAGAPNRSSYLSAALDEYLPAASTATQS